MRLLLVDGHYYLYRSFHAIQGLANAQGQPTNALYGLTKAVRRMIQDLQPDRMLVVLDGGVPDERMELVPEYKAQRPSTPVDLAHQIDQVPELMEALGIPMTQWIGEEADDVIASYAKAHAQGETIIASNDKDLMQLVNDRVRIYQPQKEGFDLLGEKEVEEKWGVPATLIGDLLSLTGDSADNIPGIPGVGPKTAAKWIKSHGSLTELLQQAPTHADEKIKKAFTEHGTQVQKNRTMVRLRNLSPLPIPITKLLIDPQFDKQIPVFQKHNFKTFLKEAQEAWKSHQPSVQGELF
ncbi:MAG: 5'-3' exonuclease H3TH domain-containing protein [Verrucomicrobiota bacterium]